MTAGKTRKSLYFRLPSFMVVSLVIFCSPLFSGTFQETILANSRFSKLTVDDKVRLWMKVSKCLIKCDFADCITSCDQLLRNEDQASRDYPFLSKLYSNLNNLKNLPDEDKSLLKVVAAMLIDKKKYLSELSAKQILASQQELIKKLKERGLIESYYGMLLLDFHSSILLANGDIKSAYEMSGYARAIASDLYGKWSPYYLMADSGYTELYFYINAGEAKKHLIDSMKIYDEQISVFYDSYPAYVRTNCKPILCENNNSYILEHVNNAIDYYFVTRRTDHHAIGLYALMFDILIDRNDLKRVEEKKIELVAVTKPLIGPDDELNYMLIDCVFSVSVGENFEKEVAAWNRLYNYYKTSLPSVEKTPAKYLMIHAIAACIDKQSVLLEKSDSKAASSLRKTAVKYLCDYRRDETLLKSHVFLYRCLQRKELNDYPDVAKLVYDYHQNISKE